MKARLCVRCHGAGWRVVTRNLMFGGEPIPVDVVRCPTCGGDGIRPSSPELIGKVA